MGGFFLVAVDILGNVRNCVRYDFGLEVVRKKRGGWRFELCAFVVSWVRCGVWVDVAFARWLWGEVSNGWRY